MIKKSARLGVEMDIVRGAVRAATETANATAAAAGAVGGAAVNGVVGGIRGTVGGIRSGLSNGSHSTPAAVLTLGAIGAGHALAASHHNRVAQELGEALEQA